MPIPRVLLTYAMSLPPRRALPLLLALCSVYQCRASHARLLDELWNKVGLDQETFEAVHREAAAYQAEMRAQLTARPDATPPRTESPAGARAPSSSASRSGGIARLLGAVRSKRSRRNG